MRLQQEKDEERDWGKPTMWEQEVTPDPRPEP